MKGLGFSIGLCGDKLILLRYCTSYVDVLRDYVISQKLLSRSGFSQKKE